MTLVMTVGYVPADCTNVSDLAFAGGCGFGSKDTEVSCMHR